MTCPQCRGTGLATQGTGHRNHRYPYTETDTYQACTCPAGDNLADNTKSATQRRIDEVRAQEDYIEQQRKERAADLARQGLADCIRCMTPADMEELKDNRGLCRKCGRDEK